MKLFLLRNADASPGKKDNARELTQKGIDSIQRLSNLVAEKNLSEISEIRHGRSVRSRQTAKQFKKAAGLKVKTREAPLMERYDDFRILADILNTTIHSILLVGHKPNLEMLISYLLTQDSKASLIRIKKSGLICLERFPKNKINPSWDCTWQISWMVHPQSQKLK